MADKNQEVKKPLSISHMDLKKHGDLSKIHGAFGQHMDAAMNLVYNNPLKSDKEFLEHANRAAEVYGSLRDQGLDHNSIVKTYHGSKGEKGMNEYWTGKSADMMGIIGQKYDKLKEKEKEAAKKKPIKKSVDTVVLGRRQNLAATYGKAIGEGIGWTPEPLIMKAEDFEGLGLEHEPDEEIEKGGEGSKGGKVVGHTKSGKPIYQGKENAFGYSQRQDHEAHNALGYHIGQAATHQQKTSVFTGGNKEKENASKDKAYKHYKKLRDHYELSHDEVKKGPEWNGQHHPRVSGDREHAILDELKNRYESEHKGKIEKAGESEIEKGGVGSGRHKEGDAVYAKDASGNYRKGTFVQYNHPDDPKTHARVKFGKQAGAQAVHKDHIHTEAEVSHDQHGKMQVKHNFEKSIEDELVEYRFEKSWPALEINEEIDTITLDQKRELLKVNGIIGGEMAQTVLKSKDGEDTGYTTYDLLEAEEQQLLNDIHGYTEDGQGNTRPNVGVEKGYVETLMKARSFQIGQLDKNRKNVKTADGWKPVSTHGHLVTHDHDGTPKEQPKAPAKGKIKNIDDAMEEAKKTEVKKEDKKIDDDFDAPVRDEHFGKFMSDIKYRSFIMNKMEKEDKAKVGTFIEGHERITKQRSDLMRKTYGSKKHQAEDDKLKQSHVSLGSKIREIIGKYK